MPKKLIAILAILVLTAAVFHIVRSAGKGGPLPHTNKHEQEVGQTAATIVKQAAESGAETTILYLFPKNHELYANRAAALRKELEPFSARLNEVWARDEGHYNDDDYTPSIDIALGDHPETSTFIVVAVGGVTHASVSTRLRAFLQQGGNFFLIGSTHPESPFVRMVESGHATILASRTTWLANAEDDEMLANASDYVRSNFTLLHKPQR